MSDLTLHWKDEHGVDRSYALESKSFLIGRREDCDLVLPYTFVSGRHARVRVVDATTLEIEDLQSTNGSFVNGAPVDRAIVKLGDELKLGRLDMRLVASATEAPPVLEESIEEITTLFQNPVEGTGGLDKLTALLEFQLQWGDRFNPPDLFLAILRHALELSRAQRAFVMVRGDVGFDFAAGLDESGESLDADTFQTSRSVVRTVSETREPMFMTSGITGDFAEEESIMAMDLNAVACLPLLSSTEGHDVSGILYLDSRRPMHQLSGLDEQILRGLAVEAARVLERVRMLEEREEREHIERELQLARQTQEQLLPQELPRSEAWELRAWCRPTRHVGGDLFDFIEREDGRLVGLLADVSGKGVAASLLSSSVQGAMQAWVRSGLDLKVCVEGLNDYLCERSRDDRFVTLFAFDLSPNGHGRFVNAGHLPALVFRAATNRVDRLDERGLVVGALEEMSYLEHELLLESGDLLLVYSDGVTEAMDLHNEEFGEERLESLFAETAAQGLEATATALDTALAEHMGEMDPSDDVTVVLVQRSGN